MLRCSRKRRPLSPRGSAHGALGRLPRNCSVCPSALGVPSGISPPPPPRHTHTHTKIIWSRWFLSRKRESRPPFRHSANRLPSFLDRRSRTAGSSLRRRDNNALLPARRKGLAGAGGVMAEERAELSGWVAAPPFGPQCLPAGDGAPVASWGPTCVATRRGLGWGRPFGPRGTSIHRSLTSWGGEGWSSRAFEWGARAARPPSWAGDRCVTRGAGSPRAEAGAGSGRGARSGEWGLAATRAWETVSVVPGPRWRWPR